MLTYLYCYNTIQSIKQIREVIQMETMERIENIEMHIHHEYICGECGKSMNEPQDWYMSACDRCLNESAE